MRFDLTKEQFLRYSNATFLVLASFQRSEASWVYICVSWFQIFYLHSERSNGIIQCFRVSTISLEFFADPQNCGNLRNFYSNHHWSLLHCTSGRRYFVSTFDDSALDRALYTKAPSVRFSFREARLTNTFDTKLVFTTWLWDHNFFSSRLIRAAVTKILRNVY